MKKLAIAIALAAAVLAPRLQAQTTFQANLSWTAPTTPAGVTVTGYQVFRAAHGSSSFSNLTSTPVAATSYVDSTVAAGSSYDYYVETVATVSGVTGVDSGPSNILTISVPATPPPPTNLTGTVTIVTVTVTTTAKTQ